MFSYLPRPIKLLLDTKKSEYDDGLCEKAFLGVVCRSTHCIEEVYVGR